jgi:hypothetical protein
VLYVYPEIRETFYVLRLILWSGTTTPRALNFHQMLHS